VAGRSTRALRYAEAVYEVARDQGTFDVWLRQLGEIEHVLGNELAAQVLRSPAVSRERKLKILERAFPELTPEVRRLLAAMLRRGSLELLPEVASLVRRRIDDARGVQTAVVTTAIPMGQQERQLLTSRLAARTGRDIRLQERVDPSILGGVVAQVGDEIIDGSVRGRLERLRRALVGAS
jgi:F-type H+-transporting ATPase subunit delta